MPKTNGDKAFANRSLVINAGESKAVWLCDIGGNAIIRGGNNLGDGAAIPTRLPEVMARVAAQGFKHLPQPRAQTARTEPGSPAAFQMPKAQYAAMFGPTVGDQVRLGDTSLVLQVESDFTFYGDECKFGGGKTLREVRAAVLTHSTGARGLAG